MLTLLAGLNHEVLVQPKQGAAIVNDDGGADNAGTATPNW